MKKYKVLVSFTECKEIVVESTSSHEARNIAQHKIDNGEYDDFKELEDFSEKIEDVMEIENE